MFDKTVLRLGNKAFYIFGGIVLMMFIIIIILSFSNSESKKPLTCDEANEIIHSLGYESTDIANLHNTNDPNIKITGFQTDNIHFEFFELNNSTIADNVYNQYTTIMLDHRKDNYYDGTAGYSNYKMYRMSSNNVYYTLIRVENTVIYAYCNEDCKNDLFRILTNLGYNS